MIRTTVLQFMLEVPWKCTILCFLLANCYGINECNVFIGQYNQNDRNSFELSGPQKHITKESDGFHDHSTQLTMHTPSDFGVLSKLIGLPACHIRILSNTLTSHVKDNQYGMKSVFYQRFSLETFYSVTTRTGRVEEDYPITTFLKAKDSQIFYANGPITFTNLRAVSWEVK